MKIDFGQKQRMDILWCFVMFAFGIACYFGLSNEPNFWGMTALSTLMLLLMLWKKNIWIRFIFFFCLGLTIATGRTFYTHTQFLTAPLWNQTISGQVVKSYSTHSGQTLLLNNAYANESHQQLNTVRVSVKKGSPTIKTGDTLTFTGHLMPPSEQQHLRYFYQGVEAKSKAKQIIVHQAHSASFWDFLRTSIKNRLKNHLSKTQAEIAIPLVTGEQQIVSSKLYSVYRKAGIAHILSVSGFHMALLAGFIFLLIRGLFVFSPKRYTSHEIKKVAAIAAFFATGFYLFLSGCQVPALRSFMMITLVLIGIFIDRKTVSLYNLLLVGFVILLFRPEWITSISFQLSFTAVMILVSLFEDITTRIPRFKFIHAFVGAIIANVLITLALAPFIAYHFNVFNPYGILGNLLTSILFSCIVMPLLFVGVLLMPLQMDGLFIKGAGLGLDFISSIAKKISALPFSDISVPSFSAWGLGIIAFGLCLLCLIKTNKRAWGFVVILVGLFLGLVTQHPTNIVPTNNFILAHQSNQLFQNTKPKSKQKVRHQFSQNAYPTTRPWNMSLRQHKTARKGKTCNKNILSASVSF